MADQQTIIYRARNAQEAHLLKNVLDEAGIRAVVTNDVLEGGSGVDLVGWPTLARVVVNAGDAPRARVIALDFDRRKAQAIATDAAEPAAPQARQWASWPTCPQCGARRTTSCPACQTSGTSFPLADAAPDIAAEPTESSQPLLLCPTCDEPFAPEYLARCEWCGHTFDDGSANAVQPSAMWDSFNPRVAVVVMVTVAVVIGIVVYFVLVLHAG